MMDFTKLNIEFANMQNTITKYNNIQNEIKNRIKNNLKDISKYNTKIKNNKDIVENECSKLIIGVLKKETDFLKKLIEEEKTNEKNNQTI